MSESHRHSQDSNNAPSIYAVAVDFMKRRFLMEDGGIVPFSTMLDDKEMETDDHRECRTIVFELAGRLNTLRVDDIDSGMRVQ